MHTSLRCQGDVEAAGISNAVDCYLSMKINVSVCCSQIKSKSNPKIEGSFFPEFHLQSKLSIPAFGFQILCNFIGKLIEVI